MDEALDNLRSHTWTGCQRGGSPSEAESYESVRYCSVCGMEDTCEDPLPPCPGESESTKELRTVLGEADDATPPLITSFRAWAIFDRSGTLCKKDAFLSNGKKVPAVYALKSSAVSCSEPGHYVLPVLVKVFMEGDDAKQT